ncbi:hypothetical protein Anapl_15786 [Anas platyrhynchos]|uniref:Uncharacterized protein n=1 Tax=Anas platyrhynchos TaxID=8839 RepID=R0JES1_ANAPL|nr:hypothetical protein Anapl_15786 [Anas platyrhynchos]
MPHRCSLRAFGLIYMKVGFMKFSGGACISISGTRGPEEWAGVCVVLSKGCGLPSAKPEGVGLEWFGFGEFPLHRLSLQTGGMCAVICIGGKLGIILWLLKLLCLVNPREIRR